MTGSSAFARRYGLVLLILVLEILALTYTVDARSLHLDGSLATAFLNRFEVAAGILFITLAVLAIALLPKAHSLMVIASSHVPDRRRWWTCLTLHAGFFACFATMCNTIYPGGVVPVKVELAQGTLLLFCLLFAATYLSLAAAALPLRNWWKLLLSIRAELILSGIAAVACVLLGRVTGKTWDKLGDWTFYVVEWLLSLVYSEVVSVPEDKLIGTASFSEIIGPACSGYQGIGLIIVFLTFFLWHFRSRLIFPRSLILLPIGCAAIWLANSFRIALLIVIGDKISPEIAVSGFHSQAGWLFFCLIAIGIAAFALNSRWLTSTPAEQLGDISSGPTLTYLLPFLSLMAGMIVTGMASSGFDWLYPLRIVVTGAVLLALAQNYRRFDWTWSWFAAVVGVATYVIWIALEAPSDGNGEKLESAVRSLGTTWDTVWIISRLVGSVIIIPLAEELAFRGYLLRRMISPHFEDVPHEQFNATALIISSLLFGALHQRWFAGTVAGFFYGLLYRRRGNLSDPILAHAVTNALIAIQVLVLGSWYLWT